MYVNLWVVPGQLEIRDFLSQAPQISVCKLVGCTCLLLIVLITYYDLLVMSSIVMNTGIPWYWEGVVTRYLY